MGYYLNMLVIRKALMEEAMAIAQLKHEMWQATYRGIYPDKKIDEYDCDANRAYFAGLIEDETRELYVALDDERIIGYMAYGRPFKPYEKYEAEILLLYVHPAYQKHGLGRKLFETAALALKQKGYKEFLVCCNRYNTKAQGFYHSFREDPVL